MELDTWDAARYERFRYERERPVHDLLALVEAVPGGRAADLGCGTGRYTPALHERVGAAATIGIDRSTKMLAESTPYARPGIDFVEGDLATLADADGSFDVLFANASFQWVPDNASLLRGLVGRLAAGGQLAFQVPANFDHPSHTIADELGRSYGLAPLARNIDSMSPARYAEVLWECGLRDLDVTLRIYGVEMTRTDEVVDWVSGTLLTSFESRLEASTFETFVAEYRRRLLSALDDPGGDRPYFYAFPRILCRARLP